MSLAPQSQIHVSILPRSFLPSWPQLVLIKAREYNAFLFLMTTSFTVVAPTKNMDRVAGGFLIRAFATYLVSISFGIYKGVLDAPDGSDSGHSNDNLSSESMTLRHITMILHLQYHVFFLMTLMESVLHMSRDTSFISRCSTHPRVHSAISSGFTSFHTARL